MTHIEALQNSTIEGNVVKLPPVQLDRDVYLKVKKSLELIGGKWKSGKIQGFVFPEDPTELLAQIAGGEKRDLKKEYQFFETPDDIADRLVKLANIQPGEDILEPSAGRGAIVKAIHRKFPGRRVYGCELMELNLSFLKKIEGFTLMHRDFLADCNDKYNVIIANPPFSKNQDINHIMKMESILHPGGRLVSVASTHWQFAQGKAEEAFRQWLDRKNAQVYPISAGEFKESGTMVATCIIVIHK